MVSPLSDILFMAFTVNLFTFKTLKLAPEKVFFIYLEEIDGLGESRSIKT